MLLLATVALLTRASVGAGPALAIGFVLLADLVEALRAREVRRAVGSVLLGLTLLLPLGTYAAVNEARFGTAFSLPYDRHRVSMVVEHRREVLAANGGTIQGPQFLPTTALQYLRPDAIGFDGSFPWIDFPRRAPVVGDVLMDQIDVASSVPSSMPALALLALLGLVVQVRRKGLHRWWAVTAGTALCLVVTLAIGFVAQRYTADAVPFLVAAGAAAIGALPMGPPSKGRRRLVLVVLVVLALASAAITAALTIQFERHYGFLTAPSLRASLAREQLALPHSSQSIGRLRVGDELPPVAPDRTFSVVGDCDGLYRSDGTSWQPVEGTPATGHYRVRIRRGVGPVPLIAGITVTWRGDDVVVARGDAPTRPVTGAGRDVVLDVVADRLLGFVDVRHEGELVLSDYFLDPQEGDVLVDGGRVDVLSTPTPVCDELVGRSS
jgi:hypothetical protein